MPIMIFNIPIRYKGVKYPAWQEIEVAAKDVKSVSTQSRGLSFIVREDVVETETPAPDKAARVKTKKEEG